MSNYMDEDNAADGFRDVPEEAGGEPLQEVVADAAPASTRRVFPTQQTVQLPQAPAPQYEEQEELTEEEEDYSEVLSDAQLRLEQGNLYQMIMNHSLFEGSDSDPKAIKNVQREIRNFAKERMEIMLGMRKETSVVERLEIDFPFNALEVDALRALARAATKGASDHSDRYVPEVMRVTEEIENVPRRTSLNPISTPRKNAPSPVQQKRASKPLPKSPSAPVKRPRVNEAIQRILEEEGVTLDQINEVFDPNQKYLTPQELAQLTPEQIVERNKQTNQRVGKSVGSTGAMPMPAQEHIDAIYTRRANEASAHPQMQMIMNLLDKKKT